MPKDILALISECREESDIDRRVELLHMINKMLPQSSRLETPSLYTNDYVNKALDRIEEGFTLTKVIAK